MALTLPGGSDVARRTTGNLRVWTAVVFVIALGVRLAVEAVNGGVTSSDQYDQSVYYAAADALLSGRAPYGDFTLVHPPLMMLALTPFAALGRLTSDPVGFQVAGFAWCVMGAANAALVTRVAARFGLSVGAATLGGLFYALWYSAVQSDVSPRLEPLGTLLFLLGLAALTGTPTRRRALLAGVALGAACCVKIWWIVPLALVLVWFGFTARSRVAAMTAAAGATIVAIIGPFFAMAPSQMLHMVVLDQVGRSRKPPTVTRIDNLLAVWREHVAWPLFRYVQIGLVGAIALVVLVNALRFRPMRMVVMIMCAQVMLLIVAPTYYSYYAGYPAAAVALTVAAGAQPLFTGGRRFAGAGLAALGLVAGAAVSSVVALAITPRPTTSVPPADLGPSLANVRCLMSDTPEALIALNKLTSNLENGCNEWVDVTGRTLGIDLPTRGRIHNAAWQRDMYSYLTSGDAVIVTRRYTGLSAATRGRLVSQPVVASKDGFTAYYTHPVPPGTRRHTG